MRGARMAVGLAYAGGPLGGTIDMFKPTVGVTKFFRLSRRSSFSVNADLGYILPFGNDDDCAYSYDELSKETTQLCVPLSERFLVGGESSVRGFKFGTLTPRETIPGQGNVT